MEYHSAMKTNRYLQQHGESPTHFAESMKHFTRRHTIWFQLWKVLGREKLNQDVKHQNSACLWKWLTGKAWGNVLIGSHVLYLDRNLGHTGISTCQNSSTGTQDLWSSLKTRFTQKKCKVWCDVLLYCPKKNIIIFAIWGTLSLSSSAPHRCKLPGTTWSLSVGLW